MKFIKYKQIARLNFIGIDDELLENQNSYYITAFKNNPNYNRINTKLLKFRLNSLHNIQLSNNCKLVLESLFIPNIFDLELNSKLSGSVIVRLKNLSDQNNFDSSSNNTSSSIIFSHTIKNNTQIFYETDGVINQKKYIVDQNGISFFNNNPKIFYNFSIPSNFLYSNVFEFEIIYNVNANQNLDYNVDYDSLKNFQCSLVIYDIDEEELLFKNTEEVNFKLMKPQNLF